MIPNGAERLSGSVLLDPNRVNRLESDQRFHIIPDLSPREVENSTWVSLEVYRFHVRGVGRGRLLVNRFNDLLGRGDELTGEGARYLIPAGPIKPEVTIDENGIATREDTMPVDFEFLFDRSLGRRTYNNLSVSMFYEGVEYEAMDLFAIRGQGNIPPTGVKYFAARWLDLKDGKVKAALYPSDPNIIKAIDFSISI